MDKTHSTTFQTLVEKDSFVHDAIVNAFLKRIDEEKTYKVVHDQLEKHVLISIDIGWKRART